MTITYITDIIRKNIERLEKVELTEEEEDDDENESEVKSDKQKSQMEILG